MVGEEKPRKEKKNFKSLWCQRIRGKVYIFFYHLSSFCVHNNTNNQLIKMYSYQDLTYLTYFDNNIVHVLLILLLFIKR